MEACEEVEEAISVSSGTKPTCRLQIESVSIKFSADGSLAYQKMRWSHWMRCKIGL